MVIPNVDDYTKIINHRKILRKTQKNNLLKSKRILKPKYKLSGAKLLHLACQEGRFAPLPPRQLRHW